MSIKQKLIGLVAIVLISFIALFGLIRYATNNLVLLKNAELMLENLQIDQLLLAKYERQYIERLNPASETAYNTTYQRLNDRFATFIETLDELDLDSNTTAQIRTEFDSYNNKFKEVSETLKKIGLTEETGLRGSLRSAVKDAESRVVKMDNAVLLAQILQLRRNEKDFIIRQDLKYLDQFEKNYKATLEKFEMSFFTDEKEKEATVERLKAYYTSFQAFVNEKKTLGLSLDTGLLGEMHKLSDASQQSMDLLSSELRSDIDAAVSSKQMFAAITILVMSIVVLALSLIISRSIILPISSLARLMKDVRQSKNLSIRADKLNRDEIGQMGKDFNEMMSTFQALIGEVNTSSQRLTDASSRLTTLAKQTAQGLSSQEHEVVQVASAVHEMESAMHEIASNTETTAHTAQEALTQASHSKATIAELIKTITSLAQQAQETNTVVQRLQADSTKIGTVLDVIKSIAEQTNLLALNASIEAARAGDHGRGFSVVADEVRSLAARTQESASEIESMITGLQRSTSSVSQLMNTSVENSNRSAEEASRSIEALEQITQGAATIVDMTTQVASATEEQASVAGEINRNVDEIRSIIGSANDQTQLNAETSVEVAEEAQQLLKAVSQFKV